MQIWNLLLVSFLGGSALGRAVAPDNSDSISVRSEAVLDGRDVEPAVVDGLEKRAGRIDRWSPIAQEMSLPLASHDEIHVDTVTWQYTHPVLPLDPSISRDLDSLGDQMANDPDTIGSRMKDALGGSIILKWHTFTGPRVVLTTTEAQAIIYGFYRQMLQHQAGWCDVRLSTSRSSMTVQISIQ
ncbi:hypothetical protein F4819DRAFT_506844 [Hypoxylon fuscum]|nr:hypothetical protein F4819DRAFT_506844 [Hypoxylon fuscum]